MVGIHRQIMNSSVGSEVDAPIITRTAERSLNERAGRRNITTLFVT
jgi:hypothetical protein